jgi:hypothetical protein
MLNLIDPATADLIFTFAVSGALLGASALAIWMMPWTDAEIEATEAAADRLLEASWRPVRLRTSR